MKRFIIAVNLFTALCTANDAFADEVKIMIQNHAFQPANVTIHSGDKVTWVNQDQDPHNVMDKASTKTFHSPALDTKESYSFTFTKAGTYDYFCTFHPMMIGKLVVQ